MPKLGGLWICTRQAARRESSPRRCEDVGWLVARFGNERQRPVNRLESGVVPIVAHAHRWSRRFTLGKRDAKKRTAGLYRRFDEQLLVCRRDVIRVLVERVGQGDRGAYRHRHGPELRVFRPLEFA